MNRFLAISLVSLTLGCDAKHTLILPTAPSQTPAAVGAPGFLGPVPGGPFYTPTATAVSDGSVVASAVEATDPVCFPNWDSNGRCRQYELTASINGTLVVTLTWPPPSRGVYDPELFLIAPNESWIYADDAPPNRRGTLPIARGGKYRIVVIAYGEFPDRFELAVKELP
jgi:hypothetical protein